MLLFALPRGGARCFRYHLWLALDLSGVSFRFLFWRCRSLPFWCVVSFLFWRCRSLDGVSRLPRRRQNSSLGFVRFVDLTGVEESTSALRLLVLLSGVACLASSTSKRSTVTNETIHRTNAVLLSLLCFALFGGGSRRRLRPAQWCRRGEGVSARRVGTPPSSLGGRVQSWWRRDILKEAYTVNLRYIPSGVYCSG